ncbi:Fe-S cluster assembly ATPase SufC [Candidatus Roizmanbacteria bacterium]|nr:Fe-S cluster assembly ATPase SufC [Candidatus Roizmanbacteria bacterium]
MIELRNLRASAGKKQILKGISYHFQKGKVYAIMGPNGSGKSTLTHVIMGNPEYKLDPASHIMLSGKDISNLSADERAKSGIFLSFQSPLSLAGVKVHQVIQMALAGQKDPLSMRQEIRKVAEELKIPEELLQRSLNEGASGGEKKKLEVLQAAVLDRNIQIYDEVDTGVDVDSLKTIAQYLNTHREGKTYIVITHYNRILEYLAPDEVLVMKDGQIVKTGNAGLAKIIEKEGYEQGSKI